MDNLSLHWLRLRKAMFCALHPSLWRKLAYGVAPTIEHAEALRRYNFRTVIDVGGNRGQFAAFARHTFPGAFIHSFEPLQMPAAIHRSVFAKDRGVCLHTVAIGELLQDANMHVTTRDDSSSLLAPTRTQTDIFGQRTERMERVPVRRLSDRIDIATLNSPALLKIDVQGGELDVLRGSSDVLASIDVIYVECSYIAMYENQPLYKEVDAWLTDRGFCLAGVFNQYTDDKIGPVQADFLFTRVPSCVNSDSATP